MIVIKNATVNGIEAKLIVKEVLTKQEQNLFLDLVDGADFWREYIMLPIEARSTKEYIRNIMLQKIKDNIMHTNGTCFVSSKDLREKTQQAESYSTLAQIYEDFKFAFSI